MPFFTHTMMTRFCTVEIVRGVWTFLLKPLFHHFQFLSLSAEPDRLQLMRNVQEQKIWSVVHADGERGACNTRYLFEGMAAAIPLLDRQFAHITATRAGIPAWRGMWGVPAVWVIFRPMRGDVSQAECICLRRCRTTRWWITPAWPSRVSRSPSRAALRSCSSSASTALFVTRCSW